MLLRALMLAIAFLFSSVALQAGTRDPAVPDAKYVEFGKKFPFVLQVKAFQKLVENGAAVKAIHRGSAVAIAPHWALTAGHIFPADNICGGELVFAEKERKALPVNVIVVHGDFDRNRTGWHDIALCYTPEDIGLDFYPSLYDTADEQNKLCTMSGFGATGTFTTGYQRVTDGLRRAGSNKVISAYKSVLICEPRRKNKTSLEFLICPGDSGGGLFIGNSVAGIVSYISGPPNGQKPRAVYGDAAAFTRVSLYVPWIRANIQLVEKALAAASAQPAGE